MCIRDSDYTKTFTDQVPGVEFQYREVGGEWKTLGYDYDPDYMSSFMLDHYDDVNQNGIYDPDVDYLINGVTDTTCIPITEREDPRNPDYFGDMVSYSGWYVNKDGGAIKDAGGNEIVGTGYAPRIVVTTWGLDNVNIADNSVFPATNGTQYEFRAIANDRPDVYGGGTNSTGTVAGDTSKFDEYVVENRVGDDKDYAKYDHNWMRDINWKLGVPFECPAVTTNDLFRMPHKDVANLEALRGPRCDGDKKDQNYWVNNIVPKAEIIRVDETTFAWTSASGVDPVAVADDIDAVVHENEHVLLAGVVNADPDGKVGGVWGTEGDAEGDVRKVAFYARPVNPNPNYYRSTVNSKWKGITEDGCLTLVNGWTQVGMGVCGSCDEDAMSDFGVGYTIRMDTSELINSLSAYGSSASNVRDFEMMALAVDDNCNMEPFMTGSGEIVIRVLDMMGPVIEVGGLALDAEHSLEALSLSLIHI